MIVYINIFVNKFIVFKNVEFMNVLRFVVGVYNLKLVIIFFINIGINYIEFDVLILYWIVFIFVDNNMILNIKFND